MTLIVSPDCAAGLRQDFLANLHTAIDPLPDTFVDAPKGGLRTMATQQALWDQGRTTPGEIVTNAKPGSSAHNYGMALDVMVLINGVPSYNGSDPDNPSPAWLRLWTAVRQAPALHGGIDFPKGETDPDHIEVLNWREHE